MAYSYQLNPETGELLGNAGTADEFATTLDVLSGGRFTIIGSQIRDTNSGRIVGNLTTTRGIDLVPLSDGGILYSNELPFNRLNDRLFTSTSETSPNRGGYYAITGEAEVLTPFGLTYSLDIRLAQVTGIGQRLAIADDPNAAELWRKLDTGSLPPGFHWASPREAAMYALQGYLISNYRFQLDQLVAANVQDENGQDINNVSDAVAFLARSTIDQLSVGSVQVLAA